MNTKKDLFSAITIIVNDYVLLACRQNSRYDAKEASQNPLYNVKEFVAGNPGGVRYADATKNGEEELRYHSNNKKSVKNVMSYVTRKSVVNDIYVPDFPSKVESECSKFAENIVGAEIINAGKETLEEVGLLITDYNRSHVFTQQNKYGDQFFFLTEDVKRFNADTGEFEKITDLVKQLPREDFDYFCQDVDIDHIRAVHVDRVFRIKEVEIIYSHKEPMRKAIAQYKSNKQYA